MYSCTSNIGLLISQFTCRNNTDNKIYIKDILKIISLVIFVCLAMWSIRNLKDHDVSYATAILRQVIKTVVSKGLLYFTGGP